MGIGQVISDTFGMVKARFGSLLGLWAIYFGITIALFFVLAIVAGVGAAGMIGSDAMAEGNLLALGGGMIVLMVLVYVGYILVAMAQYASLIFMASPLGQPSLGTALSAGWRAAPALLLLIIVLVLAYIAAALVFSVVGVALGDTGSALLLLLALPVLVWVSCRLAPLYAVVAVDGVRNPFTAIGRSWGLTRGYALKIFLASLAFLVILLLACGVLLLPSIGLLRSMADPAVLTAAESAAPALGGMLLLFAGFMVASVLFNLCYCAFMAVIHGTLTSASGEGAAETFA